MSARLPASALLLRTGLFGLALIVGALAGFAPEMAAMFTVGIAFVGLVAINFPLALVLFISEPLNLTVADSKVLLMIGIVVVVGWLAFLINDTERRRLLDQQGTILGLLALFFAWVLISLIWAESTPDALISLGKYTMGIAVAIMVMTTLTRLDSARMLYAVFIAGAVVAVLYGIASGSASSVDGERLSTAFFGPNRLAAMMVVAIAFSLGLFASRPRQELLRVGALAAAPICLLGLLMTGSRGGLVALSLVGLSAVFLGGRWRPVIITLVLAISVGASFYIAVIAPDAVRERIVKTDVGEESSREGRGTVWQVGRRMAADNLVTGVGTGNFAPRAIDYVLAPGHLTNTVEVIDTPKVAHNIYLEWLAELGVTGMLIALALLAGSVFSYLFAIRESSRSDDRGPEALARSGLLGFIGYLMACFFVSLEYNEIFWMLVGLGPALAVIARSRGGGGARARED